MAGTSASRQTFFRISNFSETSNVRIADSANLQNRQFSMQENCRNQSSGEIYTTISAKFDGIGNRHGIFKSHCLILENSTIAKSHEIQS